MGQMKHACNVHQIGGWRRMSMHAWDSRAGSGGHSHHPVASWLACLGGGGHGWGGVMSAACGRLGLDVSEPLPLMVVVFWSLWSLCSRCP